MNDLEIVKKQKLSLKQRHYLKKIYRTDIMLYKERNKISDTGDTLIQLFIEDHKFDLVIVTQNGLLPQYLIPRVYHSINDSVSGETVYFLNWL